MSSCRDQMFSTPRSRVSIWEAGTAAISGDRRVSVPSGRGGRHRIRRLSYSPALSCYLVLPILPPGSRSTVRNVFPQVRGGRCRSSAARAKCPACNGMQCAVAWLARKRVGDALRRVVLTPEAFFSREVLRPADFEMGLQASIAHRKPMLKFLYQGSKPSLAEHLRLSSM